MCQISTICWIYWIYLAVFLVFFGKSGFKCRICHYGSVLIWLDLTELVKFWQPEEIFRDQISKKIFSLVQRHTNGFNFSSWTQNYRIGAIFMYNGGVSQFPWWLYVKNSRAVLKVLVCIFIASQKWHVCIIAVTFLNRWDTAVIEGFRPLSDWNVQCGDGLVKVRTDRLPLFTTPLSVSTCHRFSFASEIYYLKILLW